MENSRLNDMLARYGEVCTQKTAAQILNIVPRTVARMCDEGRLRRVGHRVDVRSIIKTLLVAVCRWWTEAPRREKCSSFNASLRFRRS